MTNKANLEWLSEYCPSVWSLLNNQAHKQLPPGLLKYLSPLSEEQLDILAEDLPQFHRGYSFSAQPRQRYAEHRAEEGRQKLKTADKYIKVLIDVCGLQAVGDAYRRPLSHVDSVDQLAETLCEITVCAAVSTLSSASPRLKPSSERPERKTSCDVFFQIAGIPVYAEVKRYPDPPLRERGPATKDHLQPIDLYSKLEDVPEQFPEGTVNLLFVFHRPLPSKDPRQTLEQALFGWPEARLGAVSPDAPPRKNDGLFARPEWRNISGCCLCREDEASDFFLRCPAIWKNPRPVASIPPLVCSTLSR
jgi:hypothetical protein